MPLVQRSTCPHCGAPIYMPEDVGDEPPMAKYSCQCSQSIVGRSFPTMPWMRGGPAGTIIDRGVAPATVSVQTNVPTGGQG